MHRKPTLATAMTPFPHAADVDAPAVEAEALMKSHGIHHLPVTCDGRIVGMIGAHDLADRDTHDWLVRDVYRSEPYIVELTAPLENVLETMLARRIDSAIVVRQDKLAGIFTQIDVCRSYLALLRECFPPPPDDDIA